MTVALSGWWIFGWALGAIVVVIAAALLLAIIALGRRIVRQADQTTEALAGARENTAGLWDVTETNLSLIRINRGLSRAREELTS
jgi:hypothetical protein